MDIVDAQVHANMLGTEVTLAIMDALGIQAVLFESSTHPPRTGSCYPAIGSPTALFATLDPTPKRPR